VPPTEVAVLRNTFVVLHFVSASSISSTTVDVSDGNILSVLFFCVFQRSAGTHRTAPYRFRTERHSIGAAN
jgi:hypothetical protein